MLQYNTRMEKGEYTLKLQVKHHQKEMLTKLQHSTINLLHKLNQPPTIDFYPTHRDALIGGSKLQSCYVTPDKPTMFYAAPIPDDKFVEIFLFFLLNLINIFNGFSILYNNFNS